MCVTARNVRTSQENVFRQSWFEGREPRVWYVFVLVLWGRARKAVGEGVCSRMLSGIGVLSQVL